jgi:predicted RNA-binding Zn ribbon-like protein
MDALCLDFINSEFRDFRGRWTRDDLQQPDWLAHFLTKWQLQIASPTSTAPLADLIALRTLLQHMTETLVNGQLSSQDQNALNSILLKTPLQRQLIHTTTGYQLALEPQQKNWDWVQAEIAASFAHLLTSHDTRRLKICANPNCRWIFYDDSKSRTRRYCTPDKCANLLKVRRFRARHKNTDH